MVGVLLAVVELGVHDDDQMGLDGQGPHQRPGSYNNLGYESLEIVIEVFDLSVTLNPDLSLLD